MEIRLPIKFFIPLFIFIYFSLGGLGNSTAAESAFKPNILPSLNVLKITSPIKIDGRLDETAWKSAERALNFSEHNPGDMAQPPVNTVAMAVYDENNFYMAFIAYDNPKMVRASVCERDAIWQDDYIGILLDTYGDGAWTYEVLTNPLGIQGDLRWTNNGSEDSQFDMVFESVGTITDSGYQVEIAIPFKSLRFPNKPTQAWRATFWRTHPRAVRAQYSWAAIAKNTPGFATQFGSLLGIENVKPGRDFSVLPSVTAYQSSVIRDPDDPNSGLARGRGASRLSLGGKYSLSTSSTIEATWKPDFSQVESDAAQINVNSTFALFYNEARPFFQEGADLFAMPITAFYTRSINDPQFAAKLIGRMPRTSFAYVGARDQHSPIILPFEESSELLFAGKSTTNAVRMKQTFLEDSYVGGLLTTRNYDGGGSGSLGGFDGNFRLFERYYFRYQALISRTEEPNDSALTADIGQEVFDSGRHTAAYDGESFWGQAIAANFSRDAKYWNFNLSYNEFSPTFRADNGFVTSNGTRQIDFWTGRTFYFEKSWIKQFTPSFDLGHVRNYHGIHEDIWFVPELSAQLTRQTSVSVEYVWSAERFHDILFDGIRRAAVEVNSNFSRRFSAGVDVSSGHVIARNLDVPVLGRSLNLGLSATIKPLSRLVIAPEFAFAKLDYPDGRNIYKGYILRTRFNYQVTRGLMTRLIAQYDDFDRDFRLEPLISYKLNPFSIFYIGAAHAFDKYDGMNGLTATSEQYFLKFQYLLGL